MFVASFASFPFNALGKIQNLFTFSRDTRITILSDTNVRHRPGKPARSALDRDP